MPPESIQAKNYVDRAIQTEVRDLPFESVSGPTHALNYTGIDKVNGAYTDSLATLAETSVAFSSSSSGSVSRRSSKCSQLLYSRPIRSHVLAKRIASLPGSPFEASCDLRTANDSAGLRIVSLPDAMRCSLQSTDDASYPDSFGTSADTSHTSSGHDVGHRKSRAYFKLDISHTPSPPSSPDSVLIIDNDVQLPNLFLYGHSHKNTGPDDGGWITWASSPPRPIPALHGPLSLPYARCPSGAEGTLIEEDADLPRMIWGLDLEAFPPGTTTNQRTMNVHPPTTESFAPRLQMAPRILQGQPLSSISPSPEIRFLGPRHGYSVDAILRRDITIEDINKRATLRPTSHLQLARERKTKLAKDPFCTFGKQTSETCTSQIVKPHTLTTFDIARQYRVDQQKNVLPTPPTSSSPQWSPVLSGHAPFSQPDDHEQQAFSRTDHPEGHRLIDPSSANRSLGLQNMSPLVSDWTRSQPSFSSKSFQATIARERSPRSRQPPSTRSLHPDTIHQTTEFVGEYLSSLTTTTGFGTMERVSGSSTNPKHRRLSSVAEEDVGPRLKNVSPMKSKQRVYAALNDPSECVVRLSNPRHSLYMSGFSDLHAKTRNTAKATLELEAGLDPETTTSESSQSRKPTIEATPKVKLPLTGVIFSGRQDGTGTSEEIGGHHGNGKENTSNARASNNSMQKRGKARKRNMNSSTLNDRQNSISGWQASSHA
ncbi:hypothetical protein L208DRAFT_1457618 [Tricholoma matsutake]|nr:hypothetical protein L208DRAFT_1457618 [Tricholoma matsutake 945]